jgi:PBP1b-binding outer membrane lipoprotein LpoB
MYEVLDEENFVEYQWLIKQSLYTRDPLSTIALHGGTNLIPSRYNLADGKLNNQQMTSCAQIGARKKNTRSLSLNN